MQLHLEKSVNTFLSEPHAEAPYCFSAQCQKTKPQPFKGANQYIPLLYLLSLPSPGPNSLFNVVQGNHVTYHALARRIWQFESFRYLFQWCMQYLADPRNWDICFRKCISSN